MKTYSPKPIFGAKGEVTPRVLVAPQRYVQGPGVIANLGRYISILDVKRVGLLASKRGLLAEGKQVTESLRERNIDTVMAQFNGECTLEEVEGHVATLGGEKLDCLIAMGGGKPVDAGKSIAYRLNIPVVIVPTLASNDAPCSALSVLYTLEGVSDVVEYFPQNPALVVVDTNIIAAASERYLVAGMGDAMATWYEARACYSNPAATTPVGGRPTLAAYAMSEICARTIYEYGEEAGAAVAASINNDAVERVTEANTLLSGLGFESGGLAVAHPMALAYTRIDSVHHNYLHGEMVAMGTLAQLALERAKGHSDDALKATEFYARIGLPIHLGQLSLSRESTAEIQTVIEATMANPLVHNMPMSVSAEDIHQSIYDAHDLGIEVAARIGDEAYRRQQV